MVDDIAVGVSVLGERDLGLVDVQEAILVASGLTTSFDRVDNIVRRADKLLGEGFVGKIATEWFDRHHLGKFKFSSFRL